MKKLLMLIASLTVCMALTACSNITENNIGETESRFTEKRSLEGLKIVRSMDYTVSLIKTFEDLESESDLVVIGEFIDNPSTCYKQYEYDDFFQKDLLIAIASSCPIKITKVLAGDAQVGDVINVLQEEGIHNERFISNSKLTPMQMGDEWVFCLTRSVNEKYGGGYWCVSDNKGRYPTKKSASNEVMCFSDYPELGVYEQSDFNEEFYNKLIEKYGEF